VSTGIVMKPITDGELKRQFLGWQCRLRQLAMRDYGGQPMSGMRPAVALRGGEMLSPGIVVLLLPDDPLPATGYFRFQVQKTQDRQQVLDAGLKYLGADFYQLPELFTGELSAVFAPGSELAERLVKAKQVSLSFEQFSQSYRMLCKVRRLRSGDAGREMSLWHNRLYNPDLPNSAEVLCFTPDWKSASAEPWP
jgi:hypothetical protein